MEIRATGLSCLLVALLAASVDADEITMFDGTLRTGKVQTYEDDAIGFREDGGDKEVETIPLAELRRISLIPGPVPPAQGQLVVDNDRSGEVREQSGKIKLKAGFHNFTLPYWHTTGEPTLQLEYEGPGIQRTAVPPDMLFKLPAKQQEQKASTGPDADGLREPDTPGNTENQMGWRLYTWDRANLVGAVHEIRLVPVARRGSARSFNTSMAKGASQFAVIFKGYLKIPSDGEYTFYLKSDGGSQLHIGAQPRTVVPAVNRLKPEDWSVDFAGSGHVHGELTSWEESTVSLALPFGNNPLTVSLPSSRLRELWSKPVAEGGLTVDRSGEPEDVDSVYAKGSGDQVQRVSGQVVGIGDGSMRFVYEGQERKIKLDRVVGIVIRNSEAEQVDIDGVYCLLRVPGGDRIPARLQGIDGGTVTLETIWGAPLTTRRPLAAEMDIVNGRVQWLSDMEPARVEQVPWFDRVIPYRTNESTMGGPLRIGDRLYERGLCVHSRTLLEYDLPEPFERFHCELGLQRPEGALGNAAVRILADDAVLFELPSVTAETPPQVVDLDVSGRRRLTLEVDFGEQYDVGDHIVWGDPYLLRPGTTN